VDDLTQNLALALGASWASGINLYAAILVASVTEDLGVIGGLLLALKHPAVFLVALALFFLLLIWLLPKLWHALQRVWTALRQHFGGHRARPSPAVATPGAAGGAAVEGRPSAAPPKV
jgi:CBS domain containing-hemolysin-like protein